MNLADAGGIDLAKAMMQDAGMDPTLLDSYNGKQMTWEDKLKWIQSASSMTANGDQKGAQTILNILGMDPNSIATRDDVADWAFNDYARKQSFTKALSGGGSGGSRGYYRQSSEWSKSELRNLMKDRESVAAKGGDTTWYDGILADAGYPVPETKSTEKSKETGGIGLAALKELNQSSKWALPGGTTGGSTGKSTGMPYSNALSYAKGWSAEGVDSDTIYARLVNMGINDDVAAKVWNAMGW